MHTVRVLLCIASYTLNSAVRIGMLPLSAQPS